MLACANGIDEQPLRLDAMIAFPPKDTVRFSLPATAHFCDDHQSLLVEAASPLGIGVLARLNYRDTLIADAYRIIMPGDTGARGAMVAVRYVLREAPHSVALDTGRVQLSVEAGTIRGRIEGSGVENAIRTPARIEFRDLPLATDTVACAHAP